MSFKGNYTNEEKVEKSDDKPLDIYEIMAYALKVGFRYDDFYNIDFVSLMNIMSATLPKKKDSKPTQAQIDLIV